VSTISERSFTGPQRIAIQLLSLLTVGPIVVIGFLFPSWLVTSVSHGAAFLVSIGCIAVALLVHFVVDRLVYPAVRRGLMLLWLPFMIAASFITYGAAAHVISIVLFTLTFVALILGRVREID
jgi:hypothetical protein